jgi:signal peptidase II
MAEARDETRAASAGDFRFWGRYNLVGLAIAIVALVADQLHKYWMLEVYRIAERGKVTVTSFFDLVLSWNPGISYGLFPAESETGRIALIAVASLAVLALFLWMSNASSRLVAISIGLIIGGAIGNLIDRMVYGAVADFFSFHVAGFYWYVFNIADVTITAGVIGLIIDWLISPREA